MASAIQMRDKLAARKQDEFRAVQALELERRKVTLAAYAGDEEAAARLEAIRVQLADYSASMRDISQVLDDLEPKVQREFQEQRWEARRQVADKVDRSVKVAVAAAARIDDALNALTDAMAEATPALDDARTALVELTLRPSDDIGVFALNKMLGLNGAVLRPVPDMVFDRLAALGVLPLHVVGWPLPKCDSLVDMLAVAQAGASVRVRDVLASDEAAAARNAEEEAATDQPAQAA